jgi:hypothetical protein
MRAMPSWLHYPPAKPRWMRVKPLSEFDIPKGGDDIFALEYPQ